MGRLKWVSELVDVSLWCYSILGTFPRLLAEAVVKFTYEKSEDDELNLCVGDVVMNVVQVS